MRTPLGREDAQDRVEQRGLADAWPSGDDGHLGAQNQANDVALRSGEDLAGARLHPWHGTLRVDLRPGRRAAGERRQPLGDIAFRSVQAA